MIHLVTMLANQGKQEAMELDLARNDIRIVAPDFADAGAFMEVFEELEVNVDVAVIADECLGNVNKKEFFDTLRLSEPNLCLIVVLSGYRNQYIKEQIREYKESFGADALLYEGGGIEHEYLAQLIRKKYIYEYDVNVCNETTEKNESATEKAKCISIGVMGLTHGCGVTNMTVNIASYIALSEDIRVKAIDFSNTGNLRFTKCRNVTFLVHTGIDISRIQKTSRAVVYDFGVPFHISPKGKLLEYNPCYSEERINLFRTCDLKLCMSFADSWHAGKIKYLLNERQWKKSIDGSYLFVFDVASDALKNRYSKLNICGRNDSMVSERIAMLFDGKGGG